MVYHGKYFHPCLCETFLPIKPRYFVINVVFDQTLMNVFWAPTPVIKRAPIQTETTRVSVTVATSWSGSLFVKVQSRCFLISL